MTKYWGAYALSYDVEEENSIDAEDKVIQELERDFGEKVVDITLEHFGSNVEEMGE
ncbi:MAG: hypothetical protein ACPLIG_01715 [Candidatus Bathyarchaeales archaeon]